MKNQVLKLEKAIEEQEKQISKIKSPQAKQD